MKKKFRYKFLLFSLLLISGCIVFASAILGDVNGDGTVNRGDAVLITKHIVGSSLLSDISNADYNQDGKIRMDDVVGILNNMNSSSSISISSLTYWNQGNYADYYMCAYPNTIANSGCGIASYAMITSSYINPDYGPVTVRDWMCSKTETYVDTAGEEHTYFEKNNGAVSMSAMYADKTLDHFGLNAEVLFEDYSYSNTSYISSQGEKILSMVQKKRSVILSIPRHYVVIGPNSSCNSSQVYLYDPNLSSYNGCYTPQELFDTTYNYRERCYSTEKWCGWEMAVAFWPK